VKANQIWIDPGIGFGKSVEDQWTLLRNLSRLKSLGFPLLVSVSRKSFLGKTFNKPPSELLPETLQVAQLAVDQGADFLRVHDVLAHAKIVPNRC
jgi:dihydropteroate synthase